MKELKFLLFADMHYWVGHYPQAIDKVEDVVKAAHENKVDCIISCGDLCHNAPTSEPLQKAYIHNPYGIKTINCWGNHETENADTLEGILEVFGQKNSYEYYDDYDGFRIIILDSNYFIDGSGTLRHDPPHSYGERNGDRFGPEQIAWFKEALASTDRHCLVFSHASFETDAGSPDAAEMRAIVSEANRQCPGKVMLCANGHYHRNNIALTNNVVWFDVNAAINVEWQKEDNAMFPEEFKNSARMTRNCCLTEDALYAIVTVTEDGRITIDGKKSDYLYGASPEKLGWAIPCNPFGRECCPYISSANLKLVF